jgi:hypothetical protein
MVKYPYVPKLLIVTEVSARFVSEGVKEMVVEEAVIWLVNRPIALEMGRDIEK